MKKAYLLWVLGAALVMLALAGCEDVLNIVKGTDPDQPTTNGDWDGILNDFAAKTGDEAGEIQYKFKRITTDTNAVYTLYYIEGEVNRGDTIIVANQAMPVTPTSTFTALPGFKPGSSYSMVVEVTKEGTSDKARSAVLTQVKAKEGPPPIELTVSDIPTGIIKAYLLDSTGRVAVANKSGEKFTFYKYVPTATLGMGAAWNDISKAYSIELVDALTTTYTYVRGSYTFTQATGAAVTWSEFKEDTQLALLITDIPHGTTIFAATLFETPPSGVAVPKAVGLNIGGVFKFTKFVSMTELSNETYKTVGSYYIYLVTDTNGTPPNYIYKADGTTPEKFTFSQAQTTAPIAWSKFLQQP